MATMTSIDTTRLTTTGMVEVPQYVVNPTMNDICNFSEEEQASYFASLQQQWADDSSRAMNETMSWKYIYEFHHTTPFNRDACDDKIKEVLEDLTNQDPGLIVARFYHNGILNHPMFKKYVIGLQPYPEKQRTATIAYRKIEYLISVRDNLEEQSSSDNTIGQPPLSEDEETSWLRKVLERLSSYWETPERYPILYAFRYYCEHKGYLWAESCMKFAKKIANLLPFKIKDTSLNTALCNAAKHIKIEESKSYHSLTNLVPKHVHDSDDAIEECKQWKNRLDIVTKAAELDNEI